MNPLRLTLLAGACSAVSLTGLNAATVSSAGTLVDLTPAFRADELLFYLAILVILCLLILI